MSIATVRASVRFWLNAPATYAFTDPDIDRFLALEKVPDATGIRPEETGWTPTYNVLRAAGRGWLWLGGLVANKPISYKAGDVTVTVDKNYCINRSRELMGSKAAMATRRDEPLPEEHRQQYHDGIDPRFES